MPMLVRYHPSSLTREQYDTVSSKLEAAVAGQQHTGPLVHVCFGEEGNLSVSEIWNSREEWEEEGKTLMPILDEVGVQMSAPPDTFEVVNLQQS